MNNIKWSFLIPQVYPFQVYPFQKGCDDYLNAEKIAKSKKLGVYGDPKFELPWKYRERMVFKIYNK